MKFLQNPWIVGALAAGAAVVVGYQFLAPHWKSRRVTKQTAPVNAPHATPAPQPKPSSRDLTAELDSNASALQTNIDQSYLTTRFAAWVNSPQRDPFLLLSGESHGQNNETNSPLMTWKLRAIWNQTGGRLAVINRGVYAEGDEIEGYRVVRIEGSEVWFQGPHRPERLGFDRRGAIIPLPPARSMPESSGSTDDKSSSPRS